MIVACGPPTISSAPEHIAARKPGHPITLTQVHQKIYDDFAKTHPDLVSEIRCVTASPPDVLGKVRAREPGKHVDTSLILGGSDIVGALQQQKLLTALLPDHQALLPDLSRIQDAPRGFVGRHDGAGIGSTVLFVDHPSNYCHPTKWFVRSGVYAVVCPAPFYDTEHDVEAGDTLALRYDVLIADGARDVADCTRLAEQAAETDMFVS